MRTGQRVEYAARIERIVRAIEERTRAGEVPALAELAREAALSEYHCHRVFRLMTGENVGDAVTRIRLGHSLPGLERGIAEATERSGYATSQAYARALRSRTGASPSELRDDAVRREEVGSALARPEASDGGPVPSIAIEVVSLEPLRLLAVRNIGDYRELNAGYTRLFDLVLAQVSPEDLESIYGIPGDDPRAVAPEHCRFTCALATGGRGEASGELEELQLAGGRHAVLSRVGDYDQLHDALDALYAWAIETGEPIADRPLFVKFLDDPEQMPADQQRALVYLPLEGGPVA